jgi:hypothetical protein
VETLDVHVEAQVRGREFGPEAHDLLIRDTDFSTQ